MFYTKLELGFGIIDLYRSFVVFIRITCDSIDNTPIFAGFKYPICCGYLNRRVHDWLVINQARFGVSLIGCTNRKPAGDDKRYFYLHRISSPTICGTFGCFRKDRSRCLLPVGRTISPCVARSVYNNFLECIISEPPPSSTTIRGGLLLIT